MSYAIGIPLVSAQTESSKVALKSLYVLARSSQEKNDRMTSQLAWQQGWIPLPSPHNAAFGNELRQRKASGWSEILSLPGTGYPTIIEEGD